MGLFCRNRIGIAIVRTHDRTRKFYQEHAAEFAQRTLALDVADLWQKFAERIPAGGAVLDVGCGAGRDLKEFAELGFHVVGVDYASPLAAIAREYSGQDVRVGDIREIQLDAEQFDGVWALASLFHLTPSEASAVLVKLYTWLRPGGVILTTIVKGRSFEIGRDGRYFQLYVGSEWEERLVAAGFRACRTIETTAANITSLTGSEIVWMTTIAERPIGRCYGDRRASC
jgi:SAM-dependent methyltransferase